MTAFLHPWAVWAGVLATTLPVAVHLLTRPRPRRLALSTIKFLHEAVRDRRARNRLRDAVVLTCRTLAVVLFALAIARPTLDRGAAVQPDPTAAAARVVLLDVSQSMAAERHGVRPFDRARPVAAEYLRDRPDLRLGLVTAGAAAESVFDGLSVNAAALRAEVGRAAPRNERLNLKAAVARAAELLATAPEGLKRELVIVSDFQRANWAELDFAPLPEGTVIQLESVAPTEPPANLAVLRVTPPPRVEQGRDAGIEVEIGNFSEAARPVTVEVTLGDAVLRRDGVCGAWGRTTLAFEAPPRAAGWQEGVARIVAANDAVPADDVRPFVVDVRPPPAFLLLSRQPADVVPSSSYFLERALVPITPRAGRPGPRLVRLDPAQADAAALAAADVIALDHPGRLSPETVRLLATQVRRGRGLLYVAAEPQDATNLKLLADAAGGDWKLPVEFAPPPVGARRKDLFLATVRKDQPPFAVFGDGLPGVTDGLRFGGGLSSRRREEGLADDVWATYGDRTACLVVSGCGEGAVAVLNADLGASNLPAAPAFVPIVGELTARLVGRPRSADALPCGEPVALNLPPTVGLAAGLELRGPGGDPGTLADDAGGVVWRHPRPDRPGVYATAKQGKTLFAAAVAVPPDEADLRPLDVSQIPEKAGAGRVVGVRSAGGDDRDRDRTWVWLAVGCVACVLAELAALKWFRA